MCAYLVFFYFLKNTTKSRNGEAHVGLTVPAFFISAKRQKGGANNAIRSY